MVDAMVEQPPVSENRRMPLFYTRIEARAKIRLCASCCTPTLLTLAVQFVRCLLNRCRTYDLVPPPLETRPDSRENG